APEGSSHRQLVSEMFGGPESFPSRVVEADSESLITNLVESGVGVSLIRDEIVASSLAAGTLSVWSDASIATQLWLIYQATRRSDPLLSAILEVLHEIWSGVPQQLDKLPSRRNLVKAA